MTWPLVKLGDFCTTTQGVQITKADTKDEFYQGSCRYLYIADFVDDNKPSFILDLYDNKKVTENDLVMANTGSPGRVFKGKNGILSNNLFKISFDKDLVDRNYLYLVLSSNSFQNVLQSQLKGGIQKHLGHQTISRQEIPFPPLSEQKRIATILDKADAIRRKRQQTIQLADDFLRAKFLDMFGDPVANPKGWKVKKLKDLSTNILNGTTPLGGKENYVDKGIMFLRSQNVWKRKILLEDIAYIDENTHKKMSKSSLKHKDILITKTGRINTENSSLGRAAIFLGEDDSANINGHVYLIRLNSVVISEFVLYILTTNEYREYIRSVCVGGIDKRQINKEHVEEFPIIQPPLDVQNDFAKCMQLVDTMKEKAMRSHKEADNLFNALSQKAFSGQI